jgi:V8-like Glu-specific endopeptidase
VNLDDYVKRLAFSLLVVLAAFAAPRLIAADELPEIANARASVRMWADSSGSCSVVIVAPGHGYTAAHCEHLVPEGLIDGKRIVSFERINGTDAAKIVAPGLACPCVPLASKPAALNDRVFGVGYPFGAIRVLMWGLVQENPIYPEIKQFRAASFPMAPGASGGGVFNENGRLIGVISAIINQVGITLYTEIPL